MQQQAEKVGLIVNNNKTKYILINVDGKIKKYEDLNMGKVDDFCYLGANIEQTITDIKIRIQKGWAVFWNLKKIWKDPSIRIETKIRVFKALCMSVLLYNCETWILNQNTKSLLNAFGTKALRYILRIKYLDCTPNDELYKRSQMKSVLQTIEERQIKFIKESENKVDTLICEYVLYYPPHGKKKSGGQKLTFVNYYEKLVNSIKNSVSEGNFVPEGIG